MILICQAIYPSLMNIYCFIHYLSYNGIRSQIEKESAMQLLTVKESAELLRISPSTLRQWIFKHKITFVRVGRRVLFRRADLEKLVEDGVQTTHTKENSG